MSDFFNDSFDDSEGGFNNTQGFDDDDSWDDQGQDSSGGPMFNFNSRRKRYNDAYGDYRGGYGPGGGYGPRPLVPPPMPLPPPMFRPFMPPQPRIWGRGYGLGGPMPRRHPVDDRAIKYLMRCGMTKENLRNLPHDLLMLIQPDHCGLCDFSFDSFTMSRMHYISKNHLKNQKKWLTKSQGAFHNEMPLKARDLYCELCDIQITSKSHGEAHYEGKPHRGIVEGRKKPKNPLLLQSGMQHRLEQLIRREKRFLKPQKDEDKDAEGKEPKIISPELYCEICKTTVTCSEQMTMHMNGKKHLAKEKHHILTMMKGKGEDDYEEEDEGEYDEFADDVEGAGGDAMNIEGEGNDDDGAAADFQGNESWDGQDQNQSATEA